MNQMVDAQIHQKWPKELGVTRILWDYDSGWELIFAGASTSFTHNLGGDPGEYLVYISGTSDGSSLIHQANYGINSALASPNLRGVWWNHCDSNNIDIYRADDDEVPGSENNWSFVRVRILKNQ